VFDRDEFIERMIRHLRRPVEIDPGFDERVMREVAALPAGRRPGVIAIGWRWLTRPRPFALSPLAGAAVAAGLAALVLLLSARQRPATPAAREFQFVLVARATTVSLVGDFNDWDTSRTPMRPVRADPALWTAVVPLSPGRYRYAFLVNGSQWIADPGAPAAPDDEFGVPSSVVTVAGS